MKRKIYLNQKDVNVTAIYDEETGKVIIQQGSKIKNSFANSLTASEKELKQKIINDPSIIENNTFKQDYEFTSLSYAATICLGSPTNGRDVFKLENGQKVSTLFKNIPTLIDYIKENLYQFRDKKQQAEHERVNFLNHYPLEKLKDLKLEEYDKLNDPTTFMYLIERKTSTVASGFLSANNNKLFFHSKKNNKYNMAKVISNDPQNQGQSMEEIFRKYMLKYYHFVKNFDKENYDAKEYLYGANVIKMNLLLLYKGSIITGITALENIRKILDYLNITYDKTDDSVGLNIKLTNFLYEKEPSLKGESLNVITHTIWEYYNKYINNEIKYYLGGFTIDETDR